MTLKNGNSYTHLFLQMNAFSHSLTSFNPVSSVEASAVGAQIFTSWSRPLVAKTGRWGWGSRQFTWFGRKEISGSGVVCEHYSCLEPNSCHDLAWNRTTYLSLDQIALDTKWACLSFPIYRWGDAISPDIAPGASEWKAMHIAAS